MARRAALCVPATEPRKVGKALALDVDEVVVDLEDAVPTDRKDEAREAVAALQPRPHGRLAVRVNQMGSQWHRADVAACAANPAVDSIVVPKAEDPEALAALARSLHALDNGAGRRASLRIQALVESPLGVHNAVAIAGSSPQMESVIIGYADLSASFGRRVEASWQYVQDVAVLAARLAGIDAVDGPRLGIAVDEALKEDAGRASAHGFDGKWVIHPAQVATVQAAFTPTAEEVAWASEVVEVMERSTAQGLGAVKWQGQMLDEAVVVRARRLLARARTEDDR